MIPISFGPLTFWNPKISAREFWSQEICALHEIYDQISCCPNFWGTKKVMGQNEIRAHFSTSNQWTPNDSDPWFMCSPCHIRCVEIFVEPRNCCRIWNILVVVFLNCSCEINFRAPSRASRYRKGCVIRKKNIPQRFLLFFWHSKK